MIIGLGIDIVEISRIEKAVQKWGSKFLIKIYTEKEVSYCYLRKNPFAHLAARFAAKEAAIKAFSGVNRYLLNKDRENTSLLNFSYKNLRLKDIEISNDNSGSPYLIIFPSHNKNLDIFSIFLSISHEKSYAVATVIVSLKDF